MVKRPRWQPLLPRGLPGILLEPEAEGAAAVAAVGVPPARGM